MGMSKNQVKHNIHTALVCIFMLAVFFSLLYYYENKLQLDNGYHIINVDPNDPQNSTTTPIDIGNATSTGTSTPGVILRPVQVGHEIGIAAGSKLVGFSDAALDMELKGIAGLGIKWVRFDIEWGFVQQGSRDKYDWAKYDRIVDAIAKNNLKALPILTYSPEWARVPGCRGGSHCPPQYAENFADFAAEAAKRYKKKGVHYWEIWNEPNSYDFWATKADCKSYSELLKVTYPAMKNADSQALLITGGLAQVGNTDVNIAPLDFVECMYENGAKNYFDAIGFHPYTFPQLPSDNKDNGWGRMGLAQKSVRSIMIKYNDANKKIWLTEFGVPTGGPDPKWFLTEQKQADTISDSIALYKNSPWAGPLFYYTYLDSGFEPTSNENFFGLVRFDGSLKPAHNVLKELISKGI